MAGANPPIPISPAKLATKAGHRIPHRLALAQDPSPELLVSKPDDASVAPVVAPEPKPASPETVQKQPDPAQRSGSPLKLTPTSCQNRFVKRTSGVSLRAFFGPDHALGQKPTKSLLPEVFL
jgi:hypothetical protein